MTAFALGTLPMLAVISYSSLRFYRNPRFANPFRLLAGLLVVFFALVTLNNQIRLLRVPEQEGSQAAALPLDINTGALALGKEPHSGHSGSGSNPRRRSDHAHGSERLCIFSRNYHHPGRHSHAF
jgi:hypothetical protein